MIFQYEDAQFIADTLKWYTYQMAGNVEIMYHNIGTLDRLAHGGLHIRDLQTIHKALTLSANQEINAEQCLPLIIYVSQLIADAPPYPEPLCSLP